ncbi:type II CAAX prenyl endopeptidase Rce1 family protein [Marinifilum fragile]|uniref:CPBP family glutamic-type intramembrane protease n=1 Tax=Marinifilum fragile TaxID=570161 RepID=UPI002AA77C7B|nr:CPBP family glutamic-type intramembrane protease [Marinifilum fragile]
MKQITFTDYLFFPGHIHQAKFEWKSFVLFVIAYFFLGMPMSVIGGVVVKALNITNSLKQMELNFFKVVVFAPLVEESLFRLLLKPKLKNLITYSIISIVLISYLFWMEKYVIAFVLLGIQFLVLMLLYKRQEYLRNFYRIYLKRFSYFFYFSVIMFGMVHLTNFKYPELSIWIVLLSPLLILPQLLMGCILGFIRMKWGIIYCILFHATINGIACTLSAI